ncbi:MAG TPA: hypothetical protein VLF43_02235, partial [Candidatus Saccharimonadales bacterium]|nr:hypothetical protein [Candidatus Saccharimonadales bacterium]
MPKLRKYSRYSVFGLIIATMVSATTIQPLFAATNLPQLIQSHIPNYIPGDVCGAPGSTVGRVEGDLPKDILDKINEFKPMYEAAAKEAGIPWQMLPGAHYRENTFSSTQDLQAGNPIGGPYTLFSTSYDKYGKPKTLQESMTIAAKVMQDDAQTKNLEVNRKKIDLANISNEQIKDTFFSYNGRASVYAQQAADLGFSKETQPYEGSPYVMNRYDARHTDMRLISRDFGPADSIDKRYGAYTIYKLIGGPDDGTVTGLGGTTCGGGGGAISGSFDEVLLGYAHADHHPAPYYVFKPAYKAAVLEAQAAGVYVGGEKEPKGIDCGGFVSLLMRNSKTDPDYNKYMGPTSAQERWMVESGKYDRIPVSSTDNLQKGDIAINPNHTYIYIKSVPGINGNSASASLEERTPMADNAYGFGSFDWY